LIIDLGILMLSKNQILKRLKRELPILKKKNHVKSIALFGSYAREEQHEDSDIDILVEYSETPDFLEFIELEQYLSEKLECKVDLTTFGALKPALKTTILNDIVYA